MKLTYLLSLITVTMGFSAIAHANSEQMIRQRMIQESLREYLKDPQASCPCPYSVAQDGADTEGKRCGERSAYSKPGGKKPLCYPHDISDEALQAYKSNVLISRSDWSVAKRMIALSIAEYADTCACPYQKDQSGRRCGLRSAYSRPSRKGEAPRLCYVHDIDKAMLGAFLKEEK